jgi:hypothetical protein
MKLEIQLAALSLPLVKTIVISHGMSVIPVGCLGMKAFVLFVL